MTQDYLNRVPISSGLTGCPDKCELDVPAAGFAVSCSFTKAPIDYIAPYGATNEFDTNPAFSVQIEWGPGGTDIGRTSLKLLVAYSQTQNCSGVILSETCVLRSATVLHHVLLNQNIVTLVPPPAHSNLPVVALAPNTTYVETFETFSTLGGIAIAGSDLFETNTTLRFTDLATNHLACQLLPVDILATTQS